MPLFRSNKLFLLDIFFSLNFCFLLLLHYFHFIQERLCANLDALYEKVTSTLFKWRALRTKFLLKTELNDTGMNSFVKLYIVVSRGMKYWKHFHSKSFNIKYKSIFLLQNRCAFNKLFCFTLTNLFIIFMG